MQTPVMPMVSLLAAGVLLLLQVGLMVPVIWMRITGRTSLGDGGRPELVSAIRRHGNLAEVAAIYIVCLALLEMSGVPRLRVEILAGIFVLARLSHAVGLSLPKTANPFRTVGIIGTIGVGLTLGLRLIWIGWSALSA